MRSKRRQVTSGLANPFVLEAHLPLMVSGSFHIIPFSAYQVVCIDAFNHHKTLQGGCDDHGELMRKGGSDS